MLWFPHGIFAQHVLYAGPFRMASGFRIEVIGKSGNDYWAAQILHPDNPYRHRGSTEAALRQFELYDTRLRLIREDQPAVLPGTRKQWLVAGKNSLDQLMLTGDEGKTRLICSRFYTDGQRERQIRMLDSLPFSTDPSAFLLVRSEDHSKILFIAFDNSDEMTTRVYAVLFDEEWNTLYHQVISHVLFSQPCIQDDEIGFPGESFDNLPVKLANNGEWLMAAPSRISQNFSLFHACANGADYQFREIPISPYYKTEDVAMSIDNDRQEMSVGVLSGYPKTSLKTVQITNYSIEEGRFDFDTSYRFSTQTREWRDKNLSRENFMAVPGGGYLLLKEYGMPYEIGKTETPFFSNWEAAYLLAHYAESGPSKTAVPTGFNVNPGLRPIPLIRNRGDLSFFYFSSVKQDSTWSGSLFMEQHTEVNNPDLSYLMIPDHNKLYLIYNSLEGSEMPVATATTLNRQGKPTGDALIFWEMNKGLNFQKAHRFAKDEVSVPYLGNPQNGFAILRLNGIDDQ